MIISCRGLVLASSLLLFGDHVGAQQSGVVKPEAGSTKPSTLDEGNQQVSQSTTTSTSTASPSPMPTEITNPNVQLFAEWDVPNTVLNFNKEATFRYRLDAQSATQLPNFGAVLAQTNARDGEPVTTDNSWVIVQLVPCSNNVCEADATFEALDPKQFGNGNVWDDISWVFERNKDIDTDIDPGNFFLCFGSGSGSEFTCQTFSDFFRIEKDPNDQQNDSGSGQKSDTDDVIGNANEGLTSIPPLLPTGTPGGTLFMTPNEPYITYSGMPPGVIPTQSSGFPTSKDITVTASTPSSTAGTVGISGGGPTSTPGGGKKLSTGAIVGIALGSLVIVSLLAVMALIFCMRRRRRAQSAGTTHEQAMLTRDTHSQDLVAEKDGGVHTLIHPNSNDSTFLAHDQNPLIAVAAAPYGRSGGHTDNNNNNSSSGAFRDTETRDIHSSTYDHAPPTASSTAPVFTTSSPPRRKPTNASTNSAAVSALSRNLSSATTTSSTSYDDYPAHTHNTQLQGIGEEESQARYGETRHVPQVFDRGSSASPFLSEPGMSADEVARLEEEERRIDAAIAAADEARERGGGSAMR